MKHCWWRQLLGRSLGRRDQRQDQCFVQKYLLVNLQVLKTLTTQSCPLKTDGEELSPKVYEDTWWKKHRAAWSPPVRWETVFVYSSMTQPLMKNIFKSLKDQRLKCKTWHHNTPKRKRREELLSVGLGNFFFFPFLTRLQKHKQRSRNQHMGLHPTNVSAQKNN